MTVPQIGHFTDADLLSPEAIADPYPLMAALREHDPVHWSERYRSWFVMRFDDVSASLRDDRFSSDRIAPYRRAKLDAADPGVQAAFGVLEDWMVFKDPCDHTRLRRLLNRAFAPRAVTGMRPRVVEIADELLDAALARGGPVDLVGDYAYPLTASVIAEMLGVPGEDHPRFKDWSNQITGLVFGSLGNPERYAAGAAGMAELADYLTDLVRRHEREPADDLLSALINARDADDALSPGEVVSTGVLLLFADTRRRRASSAPGSSRWSAIPSSARCWRATRRWPRMPSTNCSATTALPRRWRG